MFVVVWESFGAFYQVPGGLPTCLDCLLSRVHHTASLPDCCWWVSFWKILSSSQRNSGALTVTLESLVHSLTKTLLPRLLRLESRRAPEGVLVVLIFFHSQVMEATVLVQSPNAAEFSLPFLNLVPQDNPAPDFFWLHACSMRWHAPVVPCVEAVCLAKSCPINWTGHCWSAKTGYNRAQFQAYCTCNCFVKGFFSLLSLWSVLCRISFIKMIFFPFYSILE